MLKSRERGALGTGCHVRQLLVRLKAITFVNNSGEPGTG